MMGFNIFCGRLWLVVFILVSFTRDGVLCANSTDKSNLNTALLTGYKASVQPGSDYTSQLGVNVSFMFSSLQSFVEVTGELSIVGYFEIYWIDERLSWDPSNYDNLTYTTMLQQEIWTPPFILVDSAGDLNLIGDDNLHLQILHTGKVYWSPPGRILSSCNADVTNYPFDKQSCLLRYMPWAYSSNEILLTAISPTLTLTIYSENPTWKLISTELKAVNDPQFQRFEMTITFKRRYAFYIINLILPMIFMCFINMFVFWIPIESGERMGYSTTLLLTIAVFLSIVTDALPQTSSPSIALLCYLLIIHILLSTMIMFCTIIGLRVYSKPADEPVPKLVEKFTRFVHVVTCKKNKPRCDNTVAAMTKDGEVCSVDSVKPDDNVITWMTASDAFDKVCFGSFMMVAMISNLSFLFLLSYS
ncbi:acetylcholine receptor subunit beta-type lev-1-like [Pecten maximus]|uniref:acetylcholine receptor subunit beta-type lev-1-like n=1 Tax=Pecten maximus TaxID=6579 RepID=UPI0014585CDC|nr:acetylcholine receptor subunit beta-type lev-1-like [Pecten maximus]